MAIYQLPDSNALEDQQAVLKLMAKLKQSFPTDLDYTVSLDTTLAVTQGMNDIVRTLVIALILVLAVVFVFLQGWRASLIPLLAVPVALIGTFAFFPIFGFSLNTLSLFGLVLAIGLVVDDAIVVVEATERHIEEGLAPKDAALKAMEEVAAPVVSLALILAAVFIPTIFIAGITGRLYQQFALTIVIAVILSAFNALSLSPALAAMLLKPKDKRRKSGPLGKFYDLFNRGFEKAQNGYVKIAGMLIRKSIFTVVLLGAIAALALFLGGRLPGAFLPEEDQGYAYVVAQLPFAASLERTDAFCQKVEVILKNTPGVKYYTTVEGFSLLSQVQASYNAFFFVTLQPWSERTKADQQIAGIRAHLNKELAKLPEAAATSFLPPSIPGVGTSGGFTLILEDRSGKQDDSFLSQNLARFMAAARKRPEIAGLLTTYLPSVPQVFVKVDRDKVLKLGVSLSDVYTTLQTFMGGNFVNYFNRFGRQWQVYVEADDEYRTHAENLLKFYVRNNQGQAVPLSAFTHPIPHRPRIRHAL
jgi:HAE1 family hydrophobic/amphiphilic exporter-1